ncbi:MAG: hypothetical protein V7609_2887 [Verrucomicrobiota bacterium]
MLPPEHYIDLAAGKFNKTSPADLAQLFTKVGQSAAKDHVVIHFHGGLVSRASAEASAEGLLPTYESAGAYPVFFFWRSDLWTTLSKNLSEIAQEPVFKRLVKRLLQLAFSKLKDHAGAKSGGTLPLVSESSLPDDPVLLAEYAAAREPNNATLADASLTESQVEQAELELETDAVLLEESRAIAEWTAPTVADASTTARAGTGAATAPRPTLMSTSVRNELAQEQAKTGARAGLFTVVALAKHGIMILKRVIERFAGRRDHGLYVTIVEEVLRELYLDSIGALAWTLMKNDTRDAFGADAQLFGGTAFLAELKKWWQPGRRITLVGHSTGAIYIGNFLEHADSLLDPAAKFDVVFLAPACSFEFMAEKRPFFERRVNRVRLFGLRDERERGYWEVPVLYPASLLYLVSGLFEEPTVDMPLVGMQRYFSDSDPYATPGMKTVANYFDEKCVWSLAEGAAAGLNSGAARHGGFDEDPATRESLKEFLRTGGG